VKPIESQLAKGSVQGQLDAQSREIAELKAEAITNEQSKDLIAEDLRSQVIAQMDFIENLTDTAAAHKETTDASTEHLQQQVDSIQQEVDVLAQTVASQAADIGEIRAESEPAELRQAFNEYRKAVE
jgi:chromosome segregation ATPase